MSSIYTLLGVGQLETARVCLPSLVRSCVDRGTRLIVLDDGSLSVEHRQCLEAEISRTTCISQESRDAAVQCALAGFPLCQRLRRENPITQKLFDPIILSRGERCNFVDSDVFFLRKFAGFPLSQQDGPTLFMADTQSAYTFSPSEYLRGAVPQVVARLNTGIYSVCPSVVRFEAIEAALKQNVEAYLYGPRKMWAEQTLLALLASQSAVRVLERESFQLASPALLQSLPVGLVAIHFVSPMRHLLTQQALLSPLVDEDEVYNLQTSSVAPLGKIEFFVERIIKRMGIGR